MKIISACEKAKLIAQLAFEKKGEDIVLMDMEGLSTIFDWFVLVSASSSRRLDTISGFIQKQLSRDKKIHPIHVEGRHNPYWALLDYGDVVVHIFYREIRDFYGLERLWSDARIERFDNKCLVKTSPQE